MSQWTHPICAVCWRGEKPGRDPVVYGNPEPERCCSCGAPTTDGIYVRADPNTMLAHEDHDDA